MVSRELLTPRYITWLQKEYGRLCSQTSFGRVNERAAHIKADKWRNYQPLTPAQLFDTLEDADMVTLVVQRPNNEIASLGHSTRALRYDDIDQMNVHLRVVRRPTEMRAIAHALGFLTLDSDFVVIRQDSHKEERWCIFCEVHHEVTNFIPSKRYLNGLSYACRRSIQERNTLRIRRLAG